MKSKLFCFMILFFCFPVFISAKEIARVEGTSYESLKEAIENSEEGSTIILMSDTSENITLTKPFIIDLNHYTITSSSGKSIFTIQITNGNKEEKLVIQNGTLKGGIKGNGGAISILSARTSSYESLSIDLKNLVLEENKGSNGGGLYLVSGNTLIENCEFRNNEVSNSGGAIHIATSSKESVQVKVKDSNITVNKANVGGGISMGAANYEYYGSSATLTLVNTKIEENEAKNNGGAIYLVGNGSRFVMETGEISKNKTSGNGGGIYSTNWHGIKIEQGVLKENEASIGGAIYIKNVNLKKNKVEQEKLEFKEEVIIKENKANIGGGIVVEGGVNVNIPNGVELYNNEATSYADDLYASDGNIIHLGNVVSKKSLTKCMDSITGWYQDQKKKRWDVHGSNQNVTLIESGTYEKSLSIKAAHNEKGVIVIQYQDEKGNLLEKIKNMDEIGQSYQTMKKIFDGYQLKEIKGEETGTYKKEEQTILYIYEKILPINSEIIPEAPNTKVNEISFFSWLKIIFIDKPFFLR